jgi:hypothetical protein
MHQLSIIPGRLLSRRCVSFAALLVAWNFTGCGGPKGPKVEYVEGVVTLDGKPLEGASVGYSPVPPGQGLPAGGKTDASGRYRLTAVRGGKPGGGTAVGDYGVMITKQEIIPPDEPAPPPPPPPGGPPPDTTRLRSVIPEAYGEMATSGLRVTVKPGRNTSPEFSFELDSSTPKPKQAGR